MLVLLDQEIKQMKYQVKNLASGKMIKDAITCKPRSFDTQEQAQTFAAKHQSSVSLDANWKKPGHRAIAILKVIEVAA
jgi:hypothetical protein